MAASLAHALTGEPVRVGTENPAKLGAVRAALAALLDEVPSTLAIAGVGTASGVPEQPVGWDEIAAGARNRSRAAFDSGPCALAFGIEDGLVELPGAPQGLAVFNVGCAWVTDGAREGVGFSSGFAYPPAAVGPAYRDRQPVGGLFDALWQAHRPVVDGQAGSTGGPPSGRQGGNIGQLTQGRLDRSAYGAQAILCALVPFLHVDLYD
ncbi:MAG: DUF84 family protein [Deltaproteobacteria bacterium]|nr:DUF84 family protein [Deltaproteobacteria bacterium]